MDDNRSPFGISTQRVATLLHHLEFGCWKLLVKYSLWDQYAVHNYYHPSERSPSQIAQCSYYFKKNNFYSVNDVPQMVIANFSTWLMIMFGQGLERACPKLILKLHWVVFMLTFLTYSSVAVWRGLESWPECICSCVWVREWAAVPFCTYSSNF